MIITCVVCRISTGDILNRNYQIDDSNLPPVGVDPDLVLLVPYIPYPVPDYDDRYWLLVINEPSREAIQANNFPVHPSYPMMGQFLITYTTKRRPNDDIFLSIDNAMKNSNLSVMPVDQQLECISLSQAALIKKVNGMAITEEEQASIDSLINKCVKIRQNYDLAKAYKDMVTQGSTPDIDAGWQEE